jgi:hypothetical protein
MFACLNEAWYVVIDGGKGKGLQRRSQNLEESNREKHKRKGNSYRKHLCTHGTGLLPVVVPGMRITTLHYINYPLRNPQPSHIQGTHFRPSAADDPGRAK